ncbi:hypothetical protein BDZ89DRAFT_1063982 [Hymenopellis radicata]|nr:hypothetical protein BDZ89DRAFT_1063982 [Hymenopellis radicata]
MDSVASRTPVQSASPSGVPPLEALLPLASQSLSLLTSAFAFLIHSLKWLFTKVTYPVILLTPLYYILAPFVVLAQVSLDFLVFTPYRVIVYFLDLVYPIYVLVGVACIVGLMVGGLGRLATMRITMAVYPKEPSKRVTAKRPKPNPMLRPI